MEPSAASLEEEAPPTDSEAEALHSLTVLSSEADTKWWPARENARPRTKPVCAFARHAFDRFWRDFALVDTNQRSFIPEYTFRSGHLLSHGGQCAVGGGNGQTLNLTRIRLFGFGFLRYSRIA